jgi:hypothetical protein
MINRNTYKLNLDRRLLFAAAGITAAIMPIAGELFCTPSVRAQQTTGALEFDAVSVKTVESEQQEWDGGQRDSRRDAPCSQCLAQRLDRIRIRRSDFSD